MDQTIESEHQHGTDIRCEIPDSIMVTGTKKASPISMILVTGDGGPRKMPS